MINKSLELNRVECHIEIQLNSCLNQESRLRFVESLRSGPFHSVYIYISTLKTDRSLDLSS